MIQAIIKKGKVLGEEVPVPEVTANGIKIKTVNSCISPGTETSIVINSGKSLIQRAKEKPEKVTRVLNKIKNEGIKSAYSMVMNELGLGSPIGYSLSGVVTEVGKDVKNIKRGDFVATAGSGHAEFVVAPENLVCKIPKNLSFEYASTVALGAIAMQGVRRANLSLGERCVVVGTGVIGFLVIQLLKVAGIRVAAVEPDTEKLKLAEQFGAEIICRDSSEAVKFVSQWTGGNGADSVIFTASTQSSEPLSHSFQMCKKKGTVVLVGVSGMNIKRSDIYVKELDFKISSSYGPGRYDKTYEEEGVDYPFPYVRWTAKRNMEEYLRLLAEGKISIGNLITHRFDIENISEAYERLKTKSEKPLMVILNYKKDVEELKENKIILKTKPVQKGKIKVALVGAGGFAKSVHLPNLEKLNKQFSLKAIVNKTGYTAKAFGEHFNAEYITTDFNEILNDNEVDLVMITTRHDSHAELTLKALQAGKNVFVEKPLATNQEELELIKNFYNSAKTNKPLLMVGFNRRFSPLISEIKKHTDARINPMVIHYRMNAGFIPLDHWVHKSGGRIIGEACHIIDLMNYLTGAKIKSISCEEMTPANEKYSAEDNKTFTLKYDDGSIATVSYFAVGSKGLPKEYMEIHFDGKSVILNDYKSLKGFGLKMKEVHSDFSRKGHFEELQALAEALNNKSDFPIPLWDLFQTTEATFLISENC